MSESQGSTPGFDEDQLLAFESSAAALANLEFISFFSAVNRHQRSSQLIRELPNSAVMACRMQPYLNQISVVAIQAFNFPSTSGVDSPGKGDTVENSPVSKFISTMPEPYGSIPVLATGGLVCLRYTSDSRMSLKYHLLPIHHPIAGTNKLAAVIVREARCQDITRQELNGPLKPLAVDKFSRLRTEIGDMQSGIREAAEHTVASFGDRPISSNGLLISSPEVVGNHEAACLADFILNIELLGEASKIAEE